jgi:very-short-patch-repair endonuclease
MIHPQDPTKRLPGRTSRARSLRANDTEAEYRLWSDLRNRRLNGYKFSRQIPLGSYIVDFLCREQRLVVELDGSQHAENERDDRRTDWLNRQGYSVLRFWNAEVLQERSAVLDTILAVLEGQLVERCDTIRFSPAAQEDR